MPKIMGSSSTFIDGKFGGHNGRTLRTGDVLRLQEKCVIDSIDSMPEKYRPKLTNEWTIGVIPGQQPTPEYLKPEYLKTLTESEYEVNFNSARTGIRLNGPIPQWVREDGGEAGLHPSNIHDNAYAVGTLDLTGDQSILLGPDGPSLGGFVCSVTTAKGEMWKLGQLHPGDKVHFRLLDLDQAKEIREAEEANLRHEYQEVVLPGQKDLDYHYAILAEETAAGGMREYSVEHVMATLLDDVLFGYHEVGGEGITTRQVMQYILDRQTAKRWVLGEVAFSDEYQYKFENVSLLSALLSLGEVLTEEYTWDFDTSATPWVVNLRKADASDGCGIHYARNLVGVEKTMDASALVTRLYPLGYGEGVNQLNIRSVNGGVPYLDADTASTWGVKCSVYADTRIEDAAVLKARAAAVLEGYKNPYITYTAKAIDLHRMTGQSWDNYMPGKRVRVMDGEHGISFAARIVSISKKDLRGDPGSVEITIANAVRDVADSINTLADRVGIGELYSQGATQIFAIPFADNADPEHPAKMRFYIPSGLVRINRMQLSWELSAFRAYETGAAAGGSTTQTSSSGGGSTATSSSRVEPAMAPLETKRACPSTTFTSSAPNL